ncbi:MAG: PhoPQ-activated protein PqaA family protein [Phycisphaeraceae bacterium]
MPHRVALPAVLLTCTMLLSPHPAAAGLRQYVDRPDDTYTYAIVREQAMAGGKAHVVRLQSQTWQGKPWRHWLTILVPARLEHPDKAVLMVGGGSNRDEPPAVDAAASHPFVAAASQLGVPVAVLHQVPNQPLFDGMHEDDAIAHTFEQYLKGQAQADDAGRDWPLLLPMVKSAVRAMDTVERVLAAEHGLSVDGYVVAGASKRGWTTWLTAAIDPRVQAIAPMVIDVLNFLPQMRQQQATYGQASPMIRDYTQRGLLAALDTRHGQRLTNLVDPFAYRAALTLPKLILLGTNDPYWTVDAANLYLDQLAGPTHLVYEPNAGHGLTANVMPTVMAFVERVLSNRTMPALRFDRRPTDAGEGEGVTLTVTWDEPATSAVLWQATSTDRDFRQAQWRSRQLEMADGHAEVTLEAPGAGWVAAFVQVRFAGGRSFALSTPMTVLPEHFPHRR